MNEGRTPMSDTKNAEKNIIEKKCPAERSLDEVIKFLQKISKLDRPVKLEINHVAGDKFRVNVYIPDMFEDEFTPHQPEFVIPEGITVGTEPRFVHRKNS